MRDRLSVAAEAYAGSQLRETNAAFDAADRCLTLLSFALSSPDDAVAPRLFALAMGLLEQPTLKENEPVAWIVLVRIALNELKHPNRQLAAEAARLFRETHDRDLSLYYRTQQLVGLVPQYQNEPLSNFQGILGRY